MRRYAAIIVLSILLYLVALSPLVAQSRSLVWTRWDVRIDNVDTTNNRFIVTESYDIDFSGSFRFGSAVIPVTNLEDITDVQVFEAGQVLRTSCGSEASGTYCAENTSDGLSIVYYFRQPITDDAQSFQIKYTVEGALRIYDGGDQLWWTAVPPDHFGFPINSSTITVVMPAGYAPREGVDPVETYGMPASITVNGTTITATANQPLEGDESFEIRVQYPHNPDARIPGWQSTFDQQRSFEEGTKPLVDLGVIALSLLLGLGGLLGIYALWYTRGRDPQIGPVPTYLTEPPTDLRPAVVGTLLDEKADMRDVIAILIDLARRGYVVMEETQTEGLFGLGRKSNFVFKRTDKPMDDLATYEKRLMSSLFATGMERTLESLRNSFYVVVPLLQNDLYTALVEESCLLPVRNQPVRFGQG